MTICKFCVNNVITGNIELMHDIVCSSVSSVKFALLGKKYEKYESMKSHTFFLEIFSKGNFFLFIYLFLEKYQSMIKYNKVIME